MRRPAMNSLFLPSCFSVRCQRGAPAMHHGYLVAILRQHGDRPGTAVQQVRIFQGRTTKFDNEFHASPSASSIRTSGSCSLLLARTPP